MLFSFSIFSDCCGKKFCAIFSDRRSLKIENEKDSMITLQKFDHRSHIYGIIGTLEGVLVRQGKQAIEILLYTTTKCIFLYS